MRAPVGDAASNPLRLLQAGRHVAARVLGHAGRERRVPDPGHGPAPVAAAQRVGPAEPFRQALPGDPGAQDMDHGFHELAQPFAVLLPDAG